jgi:hypothetical protein
MSSKRAKVCETIANVFLIASESLKYDDDVFSDALMVCSREWRQVSAEWRAESRSWPDDTDGVTPARLRLVEPLDRAEGEM